MSVGLGVSIGVGSGVGVGVGRSLGVGVGTSVGDGVSVGVGLGVGVGDGGPPPGLGLGEGDGFGLVRDGDGLGIERLGARATTRAGGGTGAGITVGLGAGAGSGTGEASRFRAVVSKSGAGDADGAGSKAPINACFGCPNGPKPSIRDPRASPISTRALPATVRLEINCEPPHLRECWAPVVKPRDFLLRLSGVPVEDWDREYLVSGRIRTEPSETARYSKIAALIHQFVPVPTVLDLGCGAGFLYQALRHGRLDSYTGVDQSANAIELARGFASASTTFIAADIRTWEPQGRYDAIVFNEVLYYLESPIAVVQRYSPYLTARGSVFVSIYHPRSRRRLPLRLRIVMIERSLDRLFTVVNVSWIRSPSGDLNWRVAVLSPASK
jgi:SAM-dependent methyltransferase